MGTGRNSFSLTRLQSGDLLVAGGLSTQGQGFNSTEIYDVAKATWSNGTALLGPPREHHSAELTGAGRVLIAGGKNPNVRPLATTLAFDPATKQWSSTGDLSSPRTVPGMILLESGRVLVVGGFDQLAQASGKSGFVSEALIYDDKSATWTPIDSLIKGRVFPTLTLLSDGRVFIAGGLGDQDELKDCLLSE
jgi:hypothetical protein